MPLIRRSRVFIRPVSARAASPGELVSRLSGRPTASRVEVRPGCRDGLSPSVEAEVRLNETAAASQSFARLQSCRRSQRAMQNALRPVNAHALSQAGVGNEAVRCHDPASLYKQLCGFLPRCHILQAVSQFDPDQMGVKHPGAWASMRLGSCWPIIYSMPADTKRPAVSALSQSGVLLT